MSTRTTQVRAVVNALYDLVAARTVLTAAEVRIYRYAPSQKGLPDQWITLATRITGEQEFRAAGKNLKYDTFALAGEIMTYESGAGDTAAETAMMRAETWLAEIETVLQSNPSLGRQNTNAQLGAYEHDYFANESGRQHRIKFFVNVDERMVST